MGRVKSLRNGSGAAATAGARGAAVWACRPAAGEESAAALEQQRAMAAIRAIFRVWGARAVLCIALRAKVSSARQRRSLVCLNFGSDARDASNVGPARGRAASAPDA